MLSFWFVSGLVYLIFAVFKDTFYFIKILCDTQEDEDLFKEKEEEDFKQDKIVIYNEVIDVMKSIMLLFKKKRNETKRRKTMLGRSLTKTI